MQAKIKQGLQLLAGFALSNFLILWNKNFSATVEGLALGR
jgi:hypothetical protein